MENHQGNFPVYGNNPPPTPPSKSPLKAKVTPTAASVSNYILLSKKSDQTTLTQIYKKRTPTIPLDDSDSDFEPKKRKPTETPDPSNPSKMSSKRRTKKHKRNKVPDLAQFGYLVTSSAK